MIEQRRSVPKRSPVARNHEETRILAAVRAAAEARQPVFRDEGGSLMMLAGGVLVLLEPEVSAADFFTANGVEEYESRRIGNLYFVRSEAGFPSLALANRLAVLPGVRVSQPNWWRERSLR